MKNKTIEIFSNTTIVDDIEEAFELSYSTFRENNKSPVESYAKSIQNVVETLIKTKYADKVKIRKLGDAIFGSNDTFKKILENKGDETRAFEVASDTFLSHLGLTIQERFSTREEILEENILKDINNKFLQHSDLEPNDALDKAISKDQLKILSKKYNVSEEQLFESVNLASIVFKSADFVGQNIKRENMLETSFHNTFKLAFEDDLIKNK